MASFPLFSIYLGVHISPVMLKIIKNFKFTRDQEKVRAIAYVRIFVWQVINSRPLEKYTEKYASSGTLADLVYIHYAFLIPPIRK